MTVGSLTSSAAVAGTHHVEADNKMNATKEQPREAKDDIKEMKINSEIAKSNDCDKSNEWMDVLRTHLDDPSTQILVLLLVYFDILLGATEVIADETTTYHFEPLRAMILVMHAIELVAQLVVFRTRFFEHFGYPLDALIIASRLAGLGHSHTGFLRVWRIIRLVESYVSKATEQHVETKRELSREVNGLKKKASTMESELEKERTLRKKNEEMANGSREEIETLREALKIAALDVAAAMQGQEIEMDNVDEALGPPAPVEGEGVNRDLTIRSISPVME